MKKILVVDDDTDILALVNMMLTMQKFNVESTARWEDIDHCIRAFEPDLILLDISLVGADGRDICKRIKEAKRTQHIPVVLFSANPQLGASYRDYRAEAFIEKPFNLAELVRVINGSIARAN